MLKIFNVLFLTICFSNAVSAQKQLIADSLISTKAFTYSLENGSVANIYLLSGKKGMPLLYRAHIITDVCSDGLCKPLDLTLYWDLLGNFERYQTSVRSPLTKFDHIEFSAEDHQKFRQILSDKSSILKDYDASEMVDKTVKVFSNKLDAVTGATSKSFQDVIVSGAAYTVHTLWHIVNGELSRKILTYTNERLNDELVLQLLQSDRAVYKEFIFNNLPPAQLNRYTGELIRLIGDSDPFVPHFAMSKLTPDVWTDAVHQVTILAYFKSASMEIQNTMLAKFADAKLNTSGLKLLISASSELSKVQLKKLFAIIENNKSVLTEDLTNEFLVLKKQFNDQDR